MRMNRMSIPLMPSIFFIWCLIVPIGTLALSLALLWFFYGHNSAGTLSANMINAFLQYYDKHRLNEGLQIFFNNYLAVLVVVYFTPVALWFRYLWQRYRKEQVAVTTFEMVVLYLFPALFLIRQAINIALAAGNLSFDIGKNVLVTLAGIILPHGLPELLVFSLAGAIGMEITRKLLSSERRTKLLFNLKLLGLLLVLTAGAAFIEVYFTPKVFAMLMS